MSSPQPSFFSFKSIIENSKMKVRIIISSQKVARGNKTITWVCNQTNLQQKGRRMIMTARIFKVVL